MTKPKAVETFTRPFADHWAQHPELGPEEERNLIRMKAQGSRQASDKLVASLAHHVFRMAESVATTQEEFDELVQEGFVGLYEAVKLANPRRKNRLIAFAWKRIYGRIDQAHKEWHGNTRRPAPAEIRVQTENTPEDDQNPESLLRRLQLVSHAREMLRTLMPREEFILMLRFGIGVADGCSFLIEEVAEFMRIPPDQIRRTEILALYRLRYSRYKRILGNCL